MVNNNNSKFRVFFLPDIEITSTNIPMFLKFSKCFLTTSMISNQYSMIQHQALPLRYPQKHLQKAEKRNS